MADPKGSENTPEPITPATPAGGDPTPSPTNQEETITLSKKDHDELSRKAAITETAQREAEVAKRKALEFGKKKLEQPEYLGAPELVRAKDIITSQVLQHRDYQELTASNPALARALLKDPSILLDTDSFIDAQDLANQVLSYLDDLVSKAKPTASAPTTPTPPITEAPLPSNPSPSSGPAAKSEEQRNKEEFDRKPPMEKITSKLADRIKIS